MVLAVPLILTHGLEQALQEKQHSKVPFVSGFCQIKEKHGAFPLFAHRLEQALLSEQRSQVLVMA